MLTDRFAHLRIVDSDSDSDSAEPLRHCNVAPVTNTTYKSNVGISAALPIAAAATAATAPPLFSSAANVKDDIITSTAPAGKPVGLLPHSPRAAFVNDPSSITRGSSLTRSPDKKIQSVGPGNSAVASPAAASTSGSERKRFQQSGRGELPAVPSVGHCGFRPLSASEGSGDKTRVEEARVEEARVEEKQLSPRVYMEMAEATKSKLEDWGESLEETRNVEMAEEPPAHMGGPTAVLGVQEAEEPKIASTDKSKPLPAPADDGEHRAMKRFLGERYWEKTHGYDPCKRRMPLFVAVEHCPPRHGPMQSKLPEPDVMEANPEVVRDEEPRQHESERIPLDSEREEKFIDDELAVVPPDDRLLKEESEGATGPAPNVAGVAAAEDDHAADSLSATQPAEGGDIQRAPRRRRRRASQKTGKMSGPIVPDESVLHEDEPGEVQTSVTDSKREMDANEGDGRTPFVEESEPHLPEPVIDAFTVSLSSKMALNLPGKIQSSEYAESFKMDEDHQKSTRSHVSNSIAESDQKGQAERVPNDDVMLAKDELAMIGGINVDSPKEKREVQSVNEGAAQENNETPIKNEEPVRVSELTVDSLRKLTMSRPEGTYGDIYDECEEHTDSSLYKTCISPGTTDAGSLRMGKGLPRRFPGPNNGAGAFLKRQEPSIPPFHRRLILDMEEKFQREKRNMEHSLDEYTFHPRTTSTPRGQLPRRRHKPKNGGSAESPYQASATTPSRSSPRRMAREEPLPTFKPEISQFARETQRPKIPYHERLYSPKPALSRGGPGGVSNGLSPHLSPRMMELIDGATPPLFCPDISPRAKAIENGAPFYERLYQTKAEVEQRRNGRSPGQSPPVSPRRSMRPVQLSPRLLERPAPPADTLPYSFCPDISPRAKAIENGAPFYERLYQTKAEVEQRRNGRSPGQSPPVSPRRSMRPVQLSPRLLERPTPPADTLPYSFHPQISPRARSLEANGPAYKRLYPPQEERPAVLKRQQKKFDEFLASFQPYVTEQNNRAHADSHVMGRDVVKRLTERKERSQRFVDPSLTFHPFITQKARDLKNGNLVVPPW